MEGWCCILNTDNCSESVENCTAVITETRWRKINMIIMSTFNNVIVFSNILTSILFFNIKKNELTDYIFISREEIIYLFPSFD